MNAHFLHDRLFVFNSANVYIEKFSSTHHHMNIITATLSPTSTIKLIAKMTKYVILFFIEI